MNFICIEFGLIWIIFGFGVLLFNFVFYLSKSDSLSLWILLVSLSLFAVCGLVIELQHFFGLTLLVIYIGALGIFFLFLIILLNLSDGFYFHSLQWSNELRISSLVLVCYGIYCWECLDLGLVLYSEDWGLSFNLIVLSPEVSVGSEMSSVSKLSLLLFSFPQLIFLSLFTLIIAMVFSIHIVNGQSV